MAQWAASVRPRGLPLCNCSPNITNHGSESEYSPEGYEAFLTTLSCLIISYPILSYSCVYCVVVHTHYTKLPLPPKGMQKATPQLPKCISAEALPPPAPGALRSAHIFTQCSALGTQYEPTLKPFQ